MFLGNSQIKRAGQTNYRSCLKISKFRRYSKPRLLKTLEEAVGDKNKDYSHVLIRGDFNYPQIDWESKIVSAAYHQGANDFLLMTGDNFLHQRFKCPTHYRGLQKANILDLIFTNENDLKHHTRRTDK